MQDGYLIVEQFYDAADALRAGFEAHFANPHAHSFDHQVWNYWYVPDTYTYLKTSPAKVLPEQPLTRFLTRLNQWAVSTLGLCTRLPPWLSLYVNGCGQALHNDALAGQMGYVYSLTRWDRRTFTGGETLLQRPGHYWQTDRIRTSGAGQSFFTKVPSLFNQLLLFDDRIIHGVQAVQGTMDPLQGRVVLHGHLKADVVAVAGPLPPDAAMKAAGSALEEVGRLVREAAPFVHGFMTLRLAIDPAGTVTGVRPLLDRLLPPTPDVERVDQFRRAVIDRLSGVAFPKADGPSELTLPVVVS